MENKSNIYKSKPEFVKEGFDPFSVQYGGFLKGAPLPTPPLNMFWRSPEESTSNYAVDEDGKLILLRYSDDETDYVIDYTPDEPDPFFVNQRSNVTIAELNEWGNSPFVGSVEDIDEVHHVINYRGQIYECTPTSFSPPLQDYQP